MSSFRVKDEQLREAEGRVRCGNCLQVFDGYSGKSDFVAPQVSVSETEDPLAHISVHPMDNAELPLPSQGIPAGLLVLLLCLLLLLIGQVTIHQNQKPRAPDPALSITRLVVRAHRDWDQALRLDAILYNASDSTQPYPALFLYFDNRYGERQAQRQFLPAEYLSGELTETDGIPAHTKIQVSLALQDQNHH